jgi:hypothetical protein
MIGRKVTINGLLSISLKVYLLPMFVSIGNALRPEFHFNPMINRCRMASAGPWFAGAARVPIGNRHARFFSRNSELAPLFNFRIVRTLKLIAGSAVDFIIAPLRCSLSEAS